jgi:multisubunit Na+/H+ antiporter MnhG subunit
MLSPRHRYNRVAPQIQMPSHEDGLKMLPKPDAISELLVNVVKPPPRPKGKKAPPPDPAVVRALLKFQQPAIRFVMDAMLLATLDYEKAADLLQMTDELAVVQAYADLFFDIKVFESPTDRFAYLDGLFRRDPMHAESLRRILTFSYDDLRFFASTSGEEQVEPGKALQDALTMNYRYMMAFGNSARSIETLINVHDDEAFKRLQATMNMFTTASMSVHKLAETIMRFDLNKTKDNFLHSFAMKLMTAPVEQHIIGKATIEAEAIEIV